GTIVPIKKIVQKAKEVGAATLVDGAQGVPHMGVDVQDVDCDFLALSSHKMCGPTGVGVLYGKKDLLEAMPPYQFGGDMVKEVFDDHTTWNDLPHKFEAGTPDIANVIGFGAAIDYLAQFPFEEILKHDQDLVQYARQQLASIPKLQLYGPQDVSLAGGIISFNIPGVHPHDVGSIMNNEGVAIRTGHHCAQPLLNRLGCNATARMSFYIYNNRSDVDRAVEAIKKVYEIFKVEV
ncbi:aminotransferase class V-fold PLP-dependent enzyme, partial [Candidatus Peregrinibacteria bacterium]|nr:aminotransferase class V-fold PLP-dependent enzyme [Candidatus Peregrinibacteria bacterium]